MLPLSQLPLHTVQYPWEPPLFSLSQVRTSAFVPVDIWHAAGQSNTNETPDRVDSPDLGEYCPRPSQVKADIQRMCAPQPMQPIPGPAIVPAPVPAPVRAAAAPNAEEHSDASQLFAPDHSVQWADLPQLPRHAPAVILSPRYPLAAAAVGGGGGGGGSIFIDVEARCKHYRLVISNRLCAYMTNACEELHLPAMVDAFSHAKYTFETNSKDLAVVRADSLLSYTKWIDHAFWVARKFFSDTFFPDPKERMQLTRSFFIISMHLYFASGGESRRLAPTSHVTGDGNSIMYPQRRSDKRPQYTDNNLPTSMVPGKKYIVAARCVFWPDDVSIQDLWDHDACALLALVPELSGAVTVASGQRLDERPFKQLLYTSTYWPALTVRGQVCVLIDECVRKMCTFNNLFYNATVGTVKIGLSPWWPVVEAEVDAKRKRRKAESSSSAAAAAATVAPGAYPFAFNRCRRRDGREFWLTPFVKWNDTTKKADIPKMLKDQLDQQSEAQRVAVSASKRLEALYPHLYMPTPQRMQTLAYYSNSLNVDLEEITRTKVALLSQILGL